MGWVSGWSLRKRILLSASAGVILLLTVVALQGVQIVTAFTSQQLTEWSNTTEQSAKHLQAHIEQDQILIEQLAIELAYLGARDASTTNMFLANIQKRLAVFQSGLFWLGPGGETVSWVPATDEVVALLPKELSEALPAPGQEQRLSDLLRTREGRPIITYSVQMGKLGFLLAISSLDAPLAEDYLPQTAKGGHAALVDREGWVLAATEDAIRFTRDEHPEWLSKVLQAGIPAIAETNGESRLANRDMMVFAPVGDSGWGLIMGEQTSEALAATIELRRRMLFLGLVALIVVAGYAWWDTGAITRPLRRLTSLAERIAAGDLNTTVSVERRDEIGILAKTFDAMRVSLRDSRKELEVTLTETRRREREIGVLYIVTQEILGSADNRDALQTIVDRVCELPGAKAGAICLAEFPDDLLRCAAVSGSVEKNPPTLGCTCVAPQQGPAAQPCPLRGQPGDEVFIEPISRKGSAGGYLCLVALPEYNISEKDSTLLAGLTNLAGLALVHEKLQAQSRTLAVYAERERISRELHDSVSQSLSYLYSQLQLLQEILPQLSGEQLRGELDSLAEVASTAFEEARDSIFSLRVAGGGGDPLPTVIGGCVRDFKARTGLAVELDIDVTASITLNPEAEVQLVHIIQEALTNIAKHARANWVAIRAKVLETELCITVQDNGQGFDPAEPRQGRRSFGLEMMRERAESVDGSVEIDAGRNKGTCITLLVPLGS